MRQWSGHSQSAWARYGVAAISVLASTAICWGLSRAISHEIAFMVFIPAVLVAAWYGGTGPAVAALIAGSLLGDRFMLAPPGSPEDQGPVEIGILAAFCMSSLVSMCLVMALRRAQQQAIDHAQKLEHEGAERQKAQAAARRYDLLAENSRDIILFIRRADGRILDANAAAVEAYGYSREELLSLSIADLRAPEERHVLPQQLERADASSLFFETVHQRKDGTRFPVEANSRGVTIGSERALLSVVRDISERAQAERLVKESQQMLRLVLDTVPVRVFWKDRNSRYLGCNQATARDLGFASPEQIVGKSDSELAWARYADAYRTDDHQVMERGQGRLDYQEPEVRADGQSRWVRTSKVPLRDAEGSIIGVLGTYEDITERTRMEQLLRESEHKYRQIVETSSEGIWVIDAAGRTTFANGRLCDMLGYTLEELSALDLMRVVAPECLPDARRGFADTRAGRPVTCEFRLIRKDGSTLWVMLSNNAIFDEQGQFAGALGMLTDITERKEAEDRLRETATRLNRAQEIAHLGSWELDLIRNELSWSDEVYRIFGLAPQEFAATYEAFLEAVHPEDRAAVDAAYSGSLREGRDSYQIEHRVIRRATGEVRVVHEKCEHVRDASGRIIRSVGMVHDITDRRRAEDSLRESEERLRLALEGSGMAIWEWHPATGHVNWSDHASDLVGVPPGHVASGDLQTFHDMVHPDDLPGLQGAVEHALVHRTRFEHEFRVVGPHDGQLRWLANFAQPYYDANGQPVKLVGVAADITGRKKAEATLLAAKLDAEQASASKDRFIAMLSHELRTPLTPALAATSRLACDRRLPEEVREDLNMVTRNITLEARLIDDLLEITHIATGKLLLRQEQIDVAEVLREVIRMCAPEAEGKRLKVVPETPCTVCPMFADATRLHQVFWNLLKNAIKFTPQGGTITVRSSCQTRDNETWFKVEFSDTGMGIDADVLPRLFRPFEQGRRVISDTFGGLGLGLSIAKAVVEMHGGRICADSGGSGQGATFTVELPLKPTVTTPQPAVPPSEGEETVPAICKPMRILLVEDHADTAKLIGRLLAAEGHQVTTAGDVATATAAAEAAEFDALVCDLGLPDGSGHDLMQNLLARGKVLRGIAVSGYGSPIDLEKSRAAGFAEHLTKPVDFAALHATLIRVARE